MTSARIQPNGAAIGLGGEVQILGWALGQVLRQQCPSPGQQKPVASRPPEEQLRDLDLERSEQAAGARCLLAVRNAGSASL